jgi:hypothetical protein
MTIERPMFPPVDPTRRRFLTVVGGNDFTPPSETEALPAQGRRKYRGPYKERKPIEYQDGLPVIDPAGEEDLIFRHIADHRAAVILALSRNTLKSTALSLQFFGEPGCRV